MWEFHLDPKIVEALKGWRPGEVVQLQSLGGFFVRIHAMFPVMKQADGVDFWIVQARPQLARTLVEELSEMYRVVLQATDMEPVEIALHVGAFAERAMEKAIRLERMSDEAVHNLGEETNLA